MSVAGDEGRYRSHQFRKFSTTFYVLPARCISATHSSLLLRSSHSASQSVSMVSEIISVVLENQGILKWA